MPGFRKVSVGTPVAKSPARSAAWLNAATDLINNKVQQPPSGGTAPLHGLVNPVKVRNLTDANRLRGEVVQIGDYLLSPFDPRNPWFEGNVYDAAEPRPIAIYVQAAPEDEIIEVAITGLCVARVDVQSTTDRYAIPQDGEVTLRSTASAGAIEIISPLLATGVQEIFVLIGGSGSSLQLFKATTGISAATGLLEADRGSGTVQPLNSATGVADGDPIEIANPAFDSFTSNSIGWMNTSSTPPLVISVFCTEAS